MLKITENNIAKFFGVKYYYLFNMLRMYFLRFFVVMFFFKNVIIDCGDINLNMLPYYSMYYFFLNFYMFIVFKLKEDFDILIAESYYKKMYFFMDLNDDVKKEYKNFILYNNVEYVYKDCINIYNIKEIEKNVLFINTYKYSINKYPNDFYSRIKKLKPKFLK